MKALDMILFWANMNYHPVYEQYLVEAYEEENGPHFDEKHARECVDKMWHTEDGVQVCGEHWSIDKVKEVIETYRQFMMKEDTCWDAYVALHMWWHDLGRNYARRGENEALVEDACVWAFMDEDAVEGKIWRYMHISK